MKLLKELIDGENTPLLKTVVGRVAAITSGEERTPIFKKLAEKFGCYRSQEGANQIVESKEKCSPPKRKKMYQTVRHLAIQFKIQSRAHFFQLILKPWLVQTTC